MNNEKTGKGKKKKETQRGPKYRVVTRRTAKRESEKRIGRARREFGEEG